MGAGNIILLVLGIITTIIAVCLMIAGGGLLGANAVLTDSDGYFTTKTIEINKDS